MVELAPKTSSGDVVPEWLKSIGEIVDTVLKKPWPTESPSDTPEVAITEQVDVDTSQKEEK